MAEQTTADAKNLNAQSPLKIEMVLAELYMGGMEVMVTHLMRELRRRGHDVGATCLIDEGPLFGQLEDDGFRMRLIPSHGWRNLLNPADLTTWLRTEQPDIVHIHSGAWIKTAIAAKRADLPRVVFTHHGLDAPEGPVLRLFNWYAAHSTHELVAVSEDLKRTMLARGGVSGRSIQVLPNGIPTDVFAPSHPPAKLRKQFDIPDDAFIIGNVARMFPVKNQVGLVDAFARLRTLRDDVHLVIVGDGPLRDQVEKAIHTHQLSACVHLTGAMDNLPGVYRAFDLFALTSRNEGTSISILEAMASGTGVVVTAVGGNPSLLAHGKVGTLVSPGDPNAFAEALHRMLTDTIARQRLIAAARQHVTQHYSVTVMCDAYEALYYGTTNSQPRFIETTRSAPECVG